MSYPPPYEREIWHYQRGNVDQIQQATEQFSWENYIPHETITCDDKDPPWFNKNIKQLIQEKQYMKKLHFKRQKSSNFR